MKKKPSKKLVGADIFICIKNEGFEEEVKLNRPYRVEKMCRDSLYKTHVLIKNENRELSWYPLDCFRKRRESK